jgi:hypothetical protein
MSFTIEKEERRHFRNTRSHSIRSFTDLLQAEKIGASLNMQGKEQEGLHTLLSSTAKDDPSPFPGEPAFEEDEETIGLISFHSEKPPRSHSELLEKHTTSASKIGALVLLSLFVALIGIPLLLDRDDISPPPWDHPRDRSPTLLNIRTSPLARSGSFLFIHISKCAGATMIRELKSLVSRLFPQIQEGQEYSVKWSQTNHPSDYTLIVVRSPRRTFVVAALCIYGIHLLAIPLT